MRWGPAAFRVSLDKVVAPGFFFFFFIHIIKLYDLASFFFYINSRKPINGLSQQILCKYTSACIKNE